MWLIDRLVEHHISEAQLNGELNDLPGSGKKLVLDDDRNIPVELRATYRLMKNSGYLPPELEIRREAVELQQLLAGLELDDHHYELQAKRLVLLELKLRQAGMDTTFLRGDYSNNVQKRFKGEE